jgi:tetratricopeptide (TPR) repeat protein
LSAFERRRLEEAEAFGKQRRWVEAAAQWEVLALLRPDYPDYRKQLSDARSHIENAVAERLQAASDARLRSDHDRAQKLYLKVLSLDPENAAAAEALREIEAERVRRSRASRPVTLVRADRITPAKAVSDRAGSAVERRELDYGSMLLRQGEYLASITSLENHLRVHPRDELGRRYLGDAYFQLARERLQQGKKEEALLDLEKASRMRGADAPEISASLLSVRKAVAEDCYQQALRVQPADISQAIALWERALRYDPSHLDAAARLKQARRMERNLKAMQGSGTRS